MTPTVTVTLQLPAACAAGRTVEAVAADLRLLAVLDGFRRGDLSSGQAAEALELTRIGFLDFAASRGIATANYDLADFERELASIARRRAS